MQKKLLMIGTDRMIFDAGSAVRARQAAYAAQWDEVHIIVFSRAKDYQSEISIASNCWAYPTRSKSKWLYPLGAIRLGRFIIAKRGITNITCQDPFLTAMAGVNLKKQFSIPLEIQVHTDIGSPYFPRTTSNRIRKSLALSYLLKADSIRVVSERIQKYLVEKLGIPASKITVRPIPIDVSRIHSAPITEDLHKKYPQFEKIVLMASRLEKEKNIELALSSWKKVIVNIPKAGLVIVGQGSEKRKLMKLRGALGLDRNVVFEDWADSTRLVSYYRTTNAFLVTSFFEGYGMTLVEAHAAGCKIISTDVGVAKEVGATIVNGEPESLAQAIIIALA